MFVAVKDQLPRDTVATGGDRMRDICPGSRFG